MRNWLNPLYNLHEAPAQTSGDTDAERRRPVADLLFAFITYQTFPSDRNLNLLLSEAIVIEMGSKHFLPIAGTHKESVEKDKLWRWKHWAPDSCNNTPFMF